MYDDKAIEKLADDLSSELILLGGSPEAAEQYRGLARKLFKMGWRAERDEPLTLAVPIAQHTQARGRSERQHGWLVWQVVEGEVVCRGFARGDSGSATQPKQLFPGAKLLVSELPVANTTFRSLAEHSSGPVHDTTCRG
jgi:hypothetical protein